MKLIDFDNFLYMRGYESCEDFLMFLAKAHKSGPQKAVASRGLGDKNIY